MANYISLYSGSSGNCSVIEDNGKFILIDVGKSARITTNAIRDIGLDLKNLQGVLVSHEHSDHISGLKVFLKKLNVPVYSSTATLDYLADNDLVPAHIQLEDMTYAGHNIGEFFVKGCGGKDTEYAYKGGMCEYRYYCPNFDYQIRPFEEYEAKEFVEAIGDAETYIRLFGEVEE